MEGLDLHFNTSFEVSSARLDGLLVLLAMLLSFAFIRMSTRLMRSPRVSWWPGSVSTGGIHVHHLVFGIVLLMLAGFLEFALEPQNAWAEVFAIAFGIGIGLTLDEFALWLHLEDVYWAEEGRSSIDAVVIASIIAGAVVLGLAPFDADSSESTIGLVSVALIVLLGCTLAVLKGKATTGLIGMFIPPIGYVGAIRLAKPTSFWARRRYEPDGDKMKTAQERFERHEARVRRWQDRIGGKPHLPSPRR
jgi:hypothetical protein